MGCDCENNEGLLSAYLDGGLTPEEEEMCAEHLAGCAECREHLEELRRVRGLLRAMPPVEPPSGLLDAIVTMAEAEMQGEGRVLEILHAMPAPQPPPDLLPAIRTAAAEYLAKQQAQRLLWTRWRTRIAVAAAAAALLIAVLAPHRTETPQVAPQDVVAASSEAVSEVEPQPAAPLASTTASEPMAIAEQTPGAAFAVASRTSVARKRPRVRVESAVAVVDTSGKEAVTAVPEEVMPAATEPALAEPTLAFAPARIASSPAAPAPIEPSEAPSGEMIASLPRTITIADTENNAPATDAPTALEAELAAGVVARVVIDQFVSEHLIESAPTLLSVVIGTPTTELGPILVDEPDDSFGLCFTESMRRALSDAQNQPH